MCGIVGYVGSERAAPILMEGLHRLEYRGYDSAGLAVHDGERLAIVKAVGKLQRLDALLARSPLEGRTGIGHTRWATHGKPNEINAHPHVSGPVALVHNGIIENQAALRAELLLQGFEIVSDTDTEIVAHLVRRELDRGAGSLLDAVRRGLAFVEGTYALAVVSRDEPRLLVAARSGSPLVVGVGQGEMLCGSDVPALLSRTRDVVFLEDGDLVELRPDGYCVARLGGGRVERPVRRIDWSAQAAEKAGHKHFMQKEIFEQPEVVTATLRGRVDLDAGEVLAADLGLSEESARAVRRVYFVACGTSHHAALLGRSWVERLAGLPAVVELASEIRQREPIFSEGDLVVAISQSGETADTLFAARAARARGAQVLALCNVMDSAIARVASGALYTRAGLEIGVASTKCFTAQLAALLLLAIYLGRRRAHLSAERGRALLAALAELPAQMGAVLALDPQILALARRVVFHGNALFLGRGLGFPVALEGALKLKEISYLHAEGCPGGELEHGPRALVDERLLVVLVAPQGPTRAPMLADARDLRARGARLIAVATEGDLEMAALTPDIVWLPPIAEELLPLLAVLPLQLLAYHVADLRGNDVDQPRNLAKTVTVE
jgi:glucosamine--fructose-6-phosphate aminotransferase (isomerizing)